MTTAQLAEQNQTDQVAGNRPAVRTIFDTDPAAAGQQFLRGVHELQRSIVPVRDAVHASLSEHRSELARRKQSGGPPEALETVQRRARENHRKVERLTKQYGAADAAFRDALAGDDESAIESARRALQDADSQLTVARRESELLTDLVRERQVAVEQHEGSIEESYRVELGMAAQSQATAAVNRLREILSSGEVAELLFQYGQHSQIASHYNDQTEREPFRKSLEYV